MLRFAVIFAAVVADDCSNDLGLSECSSYLAVDADFYCGELFCKTCQDAGSCDSYCGLCVGEELVYDCDGNVAPSAWIADTLCDSRNYLYDSEFINFNCPEFDCDGKDCKTVDVNGMGGECTTSAPTAATLVPTEATISISSIQRQFDTSDDVLLYSYDCYKSLMAKALVRVRGIVTLVSNSGFYMQDESAEWSGIFVHTTSSSSLLKLLAVGNEVLVIQGFVDERLGETQLEVADNDVQIVALTLEPVVPLSVTTAQLGSFATRRTDGRGCVESGEPYEGTLVQLSDVRIVGIVADDSARLEMIDGSGVRSVLDAASSRFSAIDYLRVFLCDGAKCDLSGVSLTKLTGVVGYVYNCDSGYTHFDCLSLNRGLSFSFAVKPRGPDDLESPVFIDGAVPTRSPTRTSTHQFENITDIDFISTIQSRFTADSPASYRCAPSIYEHEIVRVEGVVTAVDTFGFFMQDRAVLFSGIYVAVFPDSEESIRVSQSQMSLAQVGDRVRVVGLVVELLGLTTIEAFGVQALSTGNAVEPLRIEQNLNYFRSVSDDGCDAANERYESMLVQVSTVVLEPLLFDGRCVGCFDTIPVSYDSSAAGLVDDYFYKDLKVDLVSDFASGTVELAALSGIVRYTAECEIEANPALCNSGRGDYYFAFVLSPRTTDDLSKDASHQSKSKGLKKSKADSVAILVGVLFSIFICLLLTSLLLLYRRKRLNLVMIAQHCEPEFEIPMATATEILDAPCSTSDCSSWLFTASSPSAVRYPIESSCRNSVHQATAASNDLQSTAQGLNRQTATAPNESTSSTLESNQQPALSSIETPEFEIDDEASGLPRNNIPSLQDAA